MNEAKFYSRRLAGDELKIWLNLGRDISCENDFIDNSEKAQLLMNLEDSMFFVSFLGDEAIGASAIYKDTARNAMALLSVRVIPEHRERVTSHIIKSSLPFFRTVAIGEVDCLVSTTAEKRFPFPIQNSLPDWSEQHLIEHGFVEAGFVASRTFATPKSLPSPILQWDTAPKSKQDLRDLFWKIERTERQDYSQFWLGIDLCETVGRLYTISIEEECVAVAGAIVFQNQLIILSLMFSAKEIDDMLFASTLIALAQENGIDNIVIYYLENTLESFNHQMIALCDKPILASKLKLMRKKL